MLRLGKGGVCERLRVIYRSATVDRESDASFFPLMPHSRLNSGQRKRAIRLAMT